MNRTFFHLKWWVLIFLFVVFGGLVMMRSTCSGLWHEQVSKIPRDLFISDNPSQYVECVFGSWNYYF